jgi:hypothetical protein
MRMRDKRPIDRVSHAFVADRIPAYRWLRSHPGRQWKVPNVEVIVHATTGPPGNAPKTRSHHGDVREDSQGEVRAHSYEEVRATVDAVLAGTVPDVSVVLVGPWDALERDRRAPLKDPDLDLVLVHGHYAHEGRVRLAASGTPSRAVPYVLRLPAGWVPGEDSLALLLDLARDEGQGLVSVLLHEEAHGVVTARLERTAAFARAAIVAAPGEDLDDAVDDVFGACWVEGETYGFLPVSRAPEPAGRRGAYRARIEAEAEAVRLAAEVERLRGQITKWRDEAAKWRRNTVELRREIGTLRRQLAAAGRMQQSLRTLLAASLRRALRRKTTPGG